MERKEVEKATTRLCRPYVSSIELQKLYKEYIEYIEYIFLVDKYVEQLEKENAELRQKIQVKESGIEQLKKDIKLFFEEQENETN